MYTKMLAAIAFALGGVAFLRWRAAVAARAYQDRTVQMILRTALTAVVTHWVETRSVARLAADLEQHDPSLSVATGDTPECAGSIYLHPYGDGLLLSARSRSGVAFYISWHPPESEVGVGYAHDDSCGPASAQTYSPVGWKSPLARWQSNRIGRHLAASAELEAMRDEVRAAFARLRADRPN